MKNVLLLPILLFCLCSRTDAQPNKKVGPALSKFLNTEFMVKFRDLRISAESAALQVQSNPTGLAQADVFSLRSAYDQTATRSNQLLENVKQDFLNPKKLQTIAEFPEMYSDGLRYKLQELSDFHTANFQQALADAAVKGYDDVDGGPMLLLFLELISLTKGLTGYFSDIRRESRMYSESYLQEHLVQPFRWRYWDELAGSSSPYEKFERSSEMNLTRPAGDDQLQNQIQRLNQTISTLPTHSGAPPQDPFYIPEETPAPQDSTLNFYYDSWTPTTAPAAKDSTKVNSKLPAGATTTPVKPSDKKQTPEDKKPVKKD